MPATEYALQNAQALGIMPKRLEILENLLNRYIADGLRQAIVIKLTRRGETVFEGCYGENTKPYGVKADTIFPVASITKPVIAVLLFMLQEDGLIDLCNCVSDYLPEFKEGERDKINLFHFLTHSSGIIDAELYPDISAYVKSEYGITEPDDGAPGEEWEAFHRKVSEAMGLDPDARNDRLNDPNYMISLKLPLKHKPRELMSYCNYGYQRLKEIIDVVTGEPIDAFAQRKLFNPLGMKDTYWQTPKEKWDRILGRGENCVGFPYINTERNYTSESGSGGLKTTVGDITKFMHMVMNKGVFDGRRILCRRSIEEMTRDHNSDLAARQPYEFDASFAAWGMGWNVRVNKKDDAGMLRTAGCIDHGGWAGTKIVLDPEEELTAAIFTAEYEKIVPIYGNILNVLYSALE